MHRVERASSHGGAGYLSDRDRLHGADALDSGTHGAAVDVTRYALGRSNRDGRSKEITCERTLPSYPVLRPGDKGPAVATLQCLLDDAKLGPVVVDSSFGSQTKAAIVRLARGTEGAVDTSGRVDRYVWLRIISRPLSESTLRSGSKGPDVVTLQRALRSAGCTIAVDGSFGSQTTDVVKRFQRATGDVPDGVVGEGTRFALQSGGPTSWRCP